MFIVMLAVLCQVVSKVENAVLPVQLVAGKQSFLLPPSCDNPCTSTSAENRSVEQVRAKERGEDVANTIIMTLKYEPRSPSTRANTETNPLCEVHPRVKTLCE